MSARAIVLPYPSCAPLGKPRTRIHIAAPLHLKLHRSSSGLFAKLVPRKLALRPLASHLCPDGEVLPVDSGDDEVDLPTKERIAGTADGRRAELPTGIWQQVKDIVAFAAPAAGLWICGPMMSLIDTAVVGQGSSVELAALGPGTVICDYMSYIFMFLSIATSNMVATSLAKKDREEAQRHISMLLFIALASGLGMLFLMNFFGTQILSAFIGPKNLGIVPAASSYVQACLGLAWR